MQNDHPRHSNANGDKAIVIDLSLLTAIERAGRRLLSRFHAGEIWFVAKLRRAGTLAESIAGTPWPRFPLHASHAGYGSPWMPVKSDKGNKVT